MQIPWFRYDSANMISNVCPMLPFRSSRGFGFVLYESAYSVASVSQCEIAQDDRVWITCKSFSWGPHGFRIFFDPIGFGWRVAFTQQQEDRAQESGGARESEEDLLRRIWTGSQRRRAQDAFLTIRRDRENRNSHERPREEIAQGRWGDWINFTSTALLPSTFFLFTLSFLVKSISTGILFRYVHRRSWLRRGHRKRNAKAGVLFFKAAKLAPFKSFFGRIWQRIPWCLSLSQRFSWLRSFLNYALQELGGKSCDVKKAVPQANGWSYPSRGAPMRGRGVPMRGRGGPFFGFPPFPAPYGYPMAYPPMGYPPYGGFPPRGGGKMARGARGRGRGRPY